MTEPIEIVELPGDSVSPGELVVIKITRPVPNRHQKPSYWFEDRDREVMLCYVMEDHPELAEHLPPDKTTYHNAHFPPEGGMAIDFTPLDEAETETW